MAAIKGHGKDYMSIHSLSSWTPSNFVFAWCSECTNCMPWGCLLLLQVLGIFWATIWFYVCPFQFGEKQNIRLVRFLNSTVMVRVGGGWVTLDEFLETNDPCRGISEDIYPTFYFILFLFLYLDTNSTRVHCLYIWKILHKVISLEYTRLWISHYCIYVYTCTM